MKEKTRWLIKDKNGNVICEVGRITVDIIQQILDNNYRLFRIVNGEEYPEDLNYVFILNESGITASEFLLYFFKKYSQPNKELDDVVFVLGKVLSRFSVEERIEIACKLMVAISWDYLMEYVKEEKLMDLVKEIKEFWGEK